MGEAFFVDKYGNKISSDEIASHIGLANLMLEKDIRVKNRI